MATEEETEWLRKRVQSTKTSQQHDLSKLMHSMSKKVESSEKGLVVKPMVFSEMNSREQVDLINMQSQADGENKWIFLYQDNLTKFVQLRPVTSKRAPEIACSKIVHGKPRNSQSQGSVERANREALKTC